MKKDKYYIELTEADIKKNRDEVIRLLRSTGREGVETLIEYLDENNYFIYAASKSRHDSFYGGLAYHSLLVYREAMRIYEAEKNGAAKDVNPKSIIISTLLHDLCKLNRYPVLPGEKPKKEAYDREKGHGRISVVNIQSMGFPLTDEEALAIRWHMSCYTKKGDLLEGEKIADGKKYARECPLVAITIGGDCNGEGISSGTPASRHTIADVLALYDVKGNRPMINNNKLEDNSCDNFSAEKAYKGIIFDTDYFDDKSAEEVAALTDYVKTHDVKVGVVTMLGKPEYTKWLKKAPLPIEHVVGGGDIKVGRFKFCKKPDPKPIRMGVAWLDLDCKEVLSVCTKEVDRDASAGAGVDVITNPSPLAIIPLLSKEVKKDKKPVNLKVPAPLTGIFGAVCGDILGSRYEHHRTKDYDFELLPKGCKVTDDTILTMAIARWLMGDRTDVYLCQELVRFATRYPGAHWGHGFKSWYESETHERRVAGSNGSAMRVSPVGYAATSLEECLALAKQSAEMTHNSPEGIAGAQAIAASIFLARQGKSKAEVKAYIEQQFGYNLDQTIDEIRDTYDLKEKFTLECNKCAAEAIICWLVSDTYEATIRHAISLGGDSDTLAAMAGSIAAATPGMEIPQEIAEKCFALMPDFLKTVMLEWEGKNLKTV